MKLTDNSYNFQPNPWRSSLSTRGSWTPPPLTDSLRSRYSGGLVGYVHYKSFQYQKWRVKNTVPSVLSCFRGVGWGGKLPRNHKLYETYCLHRWYGFLHFRYLKCLMICFCIRLRSTQLWPGQVAFDFSSPFVIWCTRLDCSAMNQQHAFKSNNHHQTKTAGNIKLHHQFFLESLPFFGRGGVLFTKQN